MTEFPPHRDDPPTPAEPEPLPVAPDADTAKLGQLEQRAAEAEAALKQAEQEALFADHDNQAMPLRIGAMERELERLGLAERLAGAAAETAHDHRWAAQFEFMWGEDAYAIREGEEPLHTHRRWRLMEQAKASETSRCIEAKALEKAVQEMTLEVEKVKDTAPYRAAVASRTREAADAARKRADEARAEADAAAEQAAVRKVNSTPDDLHP